MATIKVVQRGHVSVFVQITGLTETYSYNDRTITWYVNDEEWDTQTLPAKVASSEIFELIDLDGDTDYTIYATIKGSVGMSSTVVLDTVDTSTRVTSFSSLGKTSDSITVHFTNAYSAFTYYLRIYDVTNGQYIEEELEVNYSEIEASGGYTIEDLDPSTKYAINVGYSYEDEDEDYYSDTTWVYPSGSALQVTTNAPPKYNVGVLFGLGISSGSVTGNISDGKVTSGTSVTFTAKMDSGYSFYGWYDSNGKRVSTANPYTKTITAETILTANAIPTETLFSVTSQSIMVTTISEGIDEIILYHDNSEIDSFSSPTTDLITFDSSVYPSSTYDIEITYDFGAVKTYSVTTDDPELSASVNGNSVTVSISGGKAYTTTSWSNYPSAGTLSGNNLYKATFSGLAYDTTYTFYCTYRVADGSSYTYSSVALETTATTDEAPKYTISLSKDNATVASFNKTPNSQFEYGEWVTLTATAPSDTYLYIYSTPIIYYGTSSSGEQASTTGTLEHYVVGDQNFYAKGSRKTRTYSATATAEYVTATSQKITITDLSSTSGLDSYYYITSVTSDSPVLSLSSAQKFARSTGYITLTGLSKGEYTYYCYVYNSTYGYYYKIDSITFTAGVKVEHWKWKDETERVAFTGKGSFNVLTAARWKEFCGRFNEIIDAGSYDSSLKITIPSDLQTGSVLTAEHFNHVTNQIMWFGSTWMNKPEYQELFDWVEPGDPVLGQYFIDLETAVNDLIDAL